MKKKRVLEIGVGYGSLSQKLFEIDGIDYTAIDIAKKPINLIKKIMSNFLKKYQVKQLR